MSTFLGSHRQVPSPQPSPQPSAPQRSPLDWKQISTVNYTLDQATVLQQCRQELGGQSGLLAELSSGGVCLSLVFDWIVRYRTGCRMNGTPYKAASRTVLATLRLQASMMLLEDPEERTDKIGEMMGLEVQQGPVRFPKWDDTKVARCFAVASSTFGHSIGVLKLVLPDGNHVIGFRAQSPYCFFDPNYGSYSQRDKATYHQALTGLMLQEYSGVGAYQIWDVSALDLSKALGQQKMQTDLEDKKKRVADALIGKSFKEAVALFGPGKITPISPDGPNGEVWKGIRGKCVVLLGIKNDVICSAEAVV